MLQIGRWLHIVWRCSAQMVSYDLETMEIGICRRRNEDKAIYISISGEKQRIKLVFQHSPHRGNVLHTTHYTSEWHRIRYCENSHLFISISLEIQIYLAYYYNLRWSSGNIECRMNHKVESLNGGNVMYQKLRHAPCSYRPHCSAISS